VGGATWGNLGAQTAPLNPQKNTKMFYRRGPGRLTLTVKILVFFFVCGFI